MTSANYVAPGLYPGIVKNIRDPLLRFRVGVYVHGVTDPVTNDDQLPLAEVCGVTRGMYSPLKYGDQVVVAYLNNDRRRPMIMGFRHKGSHAGLPSTPTDYQLGQLAADDDPEYFAESQKRTQHIDDKGNLLELSEVAGEAWVHMRSGGAEIWVSMEGDEAVVKASGMVKIIATGAVKVQGGTVDVEAGTVNITSNDHDFLGTNTGNTRVSSNNRVTVAPESETPLPPGPRTPATLPSGQVDIGAEINQIAGVAYIPQYAKQTQSSNLMAAEVNIGVSPAAVLPGPLSAYSETASPGIGAATTALMTANLVTPPIIPWLVPSGADLRGGDSIPLPLVPMRPTMNVNIKCAANLKVEGGFIDIIAHSMSANITAPSVNVMALGPGGVTVESYGEAGVSVKSYGVGGTSLASYGTGGVSLSAYGSGGVTLTSVTTIDIRALSINLGA